MSAGDWIVPALLLLAVLAGVFRRVPVYDAFLRGAREGLKTAWQVLPCLAAVLLAVGLLTACGALDALCAGLARPLAALGLPAGGSAALGMLESVLQAYGPDSETGRVASAMVGSSETILYTCSVYLAAAGVKKARHALPAALLAWLAGALAAAYFCKIF